MSSPVKFIDMTARKITRAMLGIVYEQAVSIEQADGVASPPRAKDLPVIRVVEVGYNAAGFPKFRLSDGTIYPRD